MKKSEPKFEEIKEVYHQVMKKIDGPMGQFPWQDPDMYAGWLAQFYYFLVHATRLLCLAGSRFTIEEHELHLRCMDHCQEEKNHEFLALDDLKNLGYDIKNFSESPIMAQMYQSQYYLIEHMGPAALFGCILYLEGLSLNSGIPAYKAAKKAFGDDCTSFLRVHTEEDQGHIQKAFKFIEMFKPHQQESILWSLKQCSFIYESLMKELNTVPSKQQKSA